jgi:hypothetical protein
LSKISNFYKFRLLKIKKGEMTFSKQPAAHQAVGMSHVPLLLSSTAAMEVQFAFSVYL